MFSFFVCEKNFGDAQVCCTYMLVVIIVLSFWSILFLAWDSLQTCPTSFKSTRFLRFLVSHLNIVGVENLACHKVDCVACLCKSLITYEKITRCEIYVSYLSSMCTMVLIVGLRKQQLQSVSGWATKRYKLQLYVTYIQFQFYPSL